MTGSNSSKNRRSTCDQATGFALLPQHPRSKRGSPSINTVFVIIGVHKGFIFWVVIRLGLHWFNFKRVRVIRGWDGVYDGAETLGDFLAWFELQSRRELVAVDFQEVAEFSGGVRVQPFSA